MNNSGVKRYMFCKQLVNDLNILPVPCVYISEIIYQIKLHIEKLEQNAVIHNHNTHQFCRRDAVRNGVRIWELNYVINYKIKLGKYKNKAI
jgi:hypothetical protein